MRIEPIARGIVKNLSSKNSVDIEDRLIEDISLDSLAMVTLLIQLEDAFNIELDESDMNPFDLKTVGDVLNLVRKYVEEDDEP